MNILDPQSSALRPPPSGLCPPSSGFRHPSSDLCPSAPDLRPPSSVLVYRTGHLGDTVCAVPAFRRLREQFAGSRLMLLCDRPARGKVSATQVVEMLGIFDEVKTYRSGQALATLWQMARYVRAQRPELVVILPQVREPAASLAQKKKFFHWCGVRDVRGVNFPALRHAWQPNEPERLMQMLRAVGIRGKKPDYAVPVDSAARERVREKLRQLGVSEKTPYLIFCGGGKAPTQQWSLMRYAHVLKTVTDRFHLPVIGLGSAVECADYQREVSPLFPDLRLPGPLSMPEAFELLRGALAYFGNDTGPMHVAAAVGCPVAAVVSARNPPGAWDPDVEPRLVFRQRTDCEDCFLNQCVTERHRCMTGVTEEMVLAGLVPFLEKLLNQK
jgi:ADP-heptose:LPS heptosyltransferase